MTNVVIVLNGPMCAGKSTVAEAFMKKEGFFKAAYDNIKFLISNYSADNPEHRKMAHEITCQTLVGAMEQGLSVLIDGGDVQYRERYIEIAQEHHFKYLSINIEAPYEILKQRFLERVAAGKKIDRPSLTVTTVDGFDSRCERYLNENKDPEATVTFDSSILSLDEIIVEVETLINS